MIHFILNKNKANLFHFFLVYAGSAFKHAEPVFNLT